ncbi:MAG: glycoside hydrolase family 9 protein [Lachnospiraceae bacterium]
MKKRNEHSRFGWLKKGVSVLLAVTLTAEAVQVPGLSLIQTEAASKKYNYATALQKSLIFYELQKSGKLDGKEYNRNNWRGDSCLNDGKDHGVDLTGGWFDAGDHVKFNLPMSYTATTLAWAYLENKKAFDKSGQTKYLKNEVKWANDYFIKCHPKKNVYYYQVGDGNQDHTYWGAAETVEARMKRPSYSVGNKSSNGGSTVCGETAAALAAASIVFKSDKPSYSKKCLKHAKELLKMAEDAKSDAGYTAANGFYQSWSGFYDELSWANIWLYRATKEKKYLEKAESYVKNWGKEGQSNDIAYTYGQNWDDVHYGAELLIAQQDRSSKIGKQCKKAIEQNLTWWTKGAKAKSPKGLAWLSEWGSLRYSTTSAFVAMVYSNWKYADKSKAKKYKTWAKTQADYALGSSGQCFQVGYANTTKPRNVHHRTAHGTWLDQLSAEPKKSRHLLVGALVGGCKAADDKYTDDRGDYYSNEVACDYNAGFTGLMAAMYAMQGYKQPAKLDKSAGAYEKKDNIPELSVEAGINAQDNQNTINFVEIKAVVYNKTAWPAQVTNKLKYRFFVDISDAIKNGAKPQDFQIVSNYKMYEKTKVSNLKAWNEKKGIYYVEIDLSGAQIFPGGQNYYRNEVQFRIQAPGKWNYKNSPSLKGIGANSNDLKLAKNIVLYNKGKRVWGTAPDSDSAAQAEQTTGVTEQVEDALTDAQTQQAAEESDAPQQTSDVQEQNSSQQQSNAQQQNNDQQQNSTQQNSNQQQSSIQQNNDQQQNVDQQQNSNPQQIESTADDAEEEDATGATSPNDDWLHTKGGTIVDKNGKVVRLTGANWFGFNCGERLLHGLGWGADIRTVIKGCANRGINLLRIPVSTELLLEWKNGKTTSTNFSNTQYYKDNPDLVNKDGSSMNNLQVFDKMMQLCKQYGIKVMVDVHSAKADNSGHNYPLWYNTEAGITTKDWIEGWKWLVKRYKNDDTLIACDLKNEPHGKRDEKLYAKWDNSKDKNNWKYAATQCAEAILKINPNLLIVVEGVEQTPKKGHSYSEKAKKNAQSAYTNYNGAWWGGNLREAGKYPITFKGHSAWNKQVVYSPHDYGPLVYQQTWFNKKFTVKSLRKDYWYDSWGYLVEKKKAPLLIGEWGGLLDGKDNEKWMKLLSQYMNQYNMSHTFWCINPNSGDTGGLLQNDWKSWDEAKYKLLKKTLWQDSKGHFVGLDHKKGLGDKGITVTQYYKKK